VMGISPGQYRQREEAAAGLDSGATRDPGAIQNPERRRKPAAKPGKQRHA
jgi:hypothetical protein